MNCHQFKTDIIDYLYRTGSSDFLMEAERHIQSCSVCEEEVLGYQSVRSHFGALHDRQAPVPVVDHLLDLSRRKSWMQKLREIFSIPLAPPVTVMGMFLLAVVVLLRGPALTTPSPELSLNSPSLSSPALNWGGDNSKIGFQNVSRENLNPLLDMDLDSLPLSDIDLEKKWQERHRLMMEADADALMMRGRRFKAMGRVDLALNDFETITRFYPEYTYMGDVLMYRSQCHAFQGNYDKAIESLEVYLTKYPSKQPLIQPMIEGLKKQKN